MKTTLSALTSSASSYLAGIEQTQIEQQKLKASKSLGITMAEDGIKTTLAVVGATLVGVPLLPTLMGIGAYSAIQQRYAYKAGKASQ